MGSNPRYVRSFFHSICNKFKELNFIAGMDGFEPSSSALTAQRLAIRPHPKIVEYRSNLPKKKAGDSGFMINITKRYNLICY